MLTTTTFFVKTCFPNPFMIFKLGPLTESAKEVRVVLRGLIDYFFDNADGWKAVEPFPSKAKAPA